MRIRIEKHRSGTAFAATPAYRMVAAAALLAALLWGARTAAAAVVEFETLAPGAAVSGGGLVVQPMASFGPGWGGDAQLFWRPPAPVETPIRAYPHLTMLFAVPAAGEYDLRLHYTVAPDYGSFTVLVAGKRAADVVGYAPGVALRQVALGRHRLAAGANQIVFTVFGKAASSSGFIVGLDRLEAVPRGQASVLMAAPTAASTTASPSARLQRIKAAPALRPVAPISVHPNYEWPLAGAAKLFRRPGDIYMPLDFTLDPADRHFGVHFNFEALESPQATGAAWQVSTRPFPPTLPMTGDPLAPSGLVRSGVVTKRSWTFEVDFAAIATDLGWRAGPEQLRYSDAPLTPRSTTKASPRRNPSTALRDGVGLRKKASAPAAVGVASAGNQTLDTIGRVSNPFSHYFDTGGHATLYLRVLPIKGTAAAPRVVGHPSQTATITYGKRPPIPNPFAGYQWRQREIPRLSISSLSYTPMRTDHRWPKGCVPDQGGTDYWTPFDYLADAWDWATTAYADAKSFIVDTASQLLPFVPRSILAAALDGALVAAGIPPSLPNIDQLMEEGAGYIAEEAASQLVGPASNAVMNEMAGELFADAAPQMIASMTAEGLRDAVQDKLQSRLEGEIAARAKAARALTEATAASTICQTREYVPMVRLTVRNLENRRLSNVAITIADEKGIYQTLTPEVTLKPHESYDLVLPLALDLWGIAGRAKVPPTFAMEAFWENYQQTTMRLVISGPDVTSCLVHETGYVLECKKAPANDPRPLRFKTQQFLIKDARIVDLGQ